MRCILPTCDSKYYSDTNDIAFRAFPKKMPNLALWVKLLNVKYSSLRDDSVVCSKHFVAADLYKTRRGILKIRTGALPLDVPKNKSESSIVKVCRICFVSDRKLYNMRKYKNLDSAYSIVTGLSLDKEKEVKLPKYLCPECAHRLLDCVHFRSRSLRAHQILMEAVESHENVTMQSLKAVVGSEGGLGSHLKSKQINHCDLEINYDKEASEERPDERIAKEISDEEMDPIPNPENINNDEQHISHENYTSHELHENIKMDIDYIVQHDDNDTKDFPMFDEDDNEIITPDNESVLFDDCHQDTKELKDNNVNEALINDSDDKDDKVSDDDNDNNTIVNDVVRTVILKEKDRQYTYRQRKVVRIPIKPLNEGPKPNFLEYRLLADQLIITKSPSKNHPKRLSKNILIHQNMNR